MNKVKAARELFRIAQDIDTGDYIPFGDVARKQLGMQAQYACRFLDGRHGSPNLGQGVRFKYKDPTDYHSIVIHKDDVDKFVAAVKKYNEERGA